MVARAARRLGRRRGPAAGGGGMVTGVTARRSPAGMNRW